MDLIHKAHLEKHCISVDTILLSAPISEFHTFIQIQLRQWNQALQKLYIHTVQFPKTSPPYQLKLTKGVGEMVKLIKYLLKKHGYLSPSPQNPHKKSVW